MPIDRQGDVHGLLDEHPGVTVGLEFDLAGLKRLLDRPARFAAANAATAACCAASIAAGSSALTSTGSYSLFGADMGSSSHRRISGKSMGSEFRPVA